MLVKKFYQTGIHEGLSFSEKQRIELSNLFILIGIPMLTLHSIANYLGPRSTAEFALTSIWFIIFLISYLLNRSRRHHLARLFIILSSIIFMGCIHVAFGKEARFEPMYLMSIVCSIYFFNRKTRYKILMVHLVLIPLFFFLTMTIDPPLAHLLVPTGPIAYFFVSIIVLVSFTFKIINENYNYNEIVTEQNKSLTRKNTELQNFNHIVSHDLKEPIRNIVSFSSLVKRKIPLDEQSSQYIEQIISSGYQLNTLIEDLKSFQSIDTINDHIELFSPREVIAELESVFSNTLEIKNGKILINDLPRYLKFSRMAFYIIVKNLIENAFKYNQSDLPQLIISYQESDKEHEYIFADNGIGMKMEYATEIFKMFKRLHNRVEYAGTGLGLNISQKTADRFGAKIELTKSVIGEGSVFTLQIPKV